jgi:hypothetical protein
MQWYGLAVVSNWSGSQSLVGGEGDSEASDESDCGILNMAGYQVDVLVHDLLQNRCKRG